MKSINKRTAIIIGIVIVCLVALGGIAFALMPKADSVVENKTMSVQVQCDGWNETTSTPIVVSVYRDDVKSTLTSTDATVVDPDPIQTVQAKAGETISFSDVTEEGTYTVAIKGSPVLEDGTIFTVPDPQVIEYKTADGAEVQFTLTKKDASQVTEADIAAATAAAEAVGADTTKVASNTNSTRTTASSAQGGSMQQGSATSGSAGGGFAGGSASEPAHTHSWVYHDAVYNTVNHPAVTKEVGVCNDCGVQDPSRDHLYQHALNGGSGGTHGSVITVTPAYSEQVLVSNAYYSCSCGATK